MVQGPRAGAVPGKGGNPWKTYLSPMAVANTFLHR